MKIGDAVRAAVGGYWSRPSGLLPYYLLGASAGAIGRSVWLAGLVVAYATMSAQGTLAPIREELAAVGPIQIDDPQTYPESTEASEAIGEAIVAAATPELLAVLAVSALAAILISLVANAVASATQIHADYAVLEGRDPIRAGVDGVARDYRTFVALAVLQLLAWIVVSGVVLGGAAAMTAATLWGGFLAPVLALLVWPLGLIAVWILFLFTEQAVVVDRIERDGRREDRPDDAEAPSARVDDARVDRDRGERPGAADERRAAHRAPPESNRDGRGPERDDGIGAIEAVRRNLGYLRANVGDALVYAVLAIGMVFVGGLVAVGLANYQASTVASVAGVLVVTPLLDLTKTALYADHATGRLPTPPAAAASARDRLVGELRAGLAELEAFVRARPGLQALSAAVFAISVAAGWRLAAGIETYFRASIAARLSDWLPPAAFLNLTANNWLVGVAQTYSGFAAGLPTLASLLFNGAYFGAIFRMEIDKLELLLFVVPHGVLEIPALIVSGALGLYLGIVGIGIVRGRTDRDTVAGAIEHAYRALIGLLVVFAAAGAIEAFVSPYYHRILGL